MKEKIIKKLKKMGLSLFILISTMETTTLTVFAEEDVQKKITDAANTIKGILTAIVGTIAICVSLFIIIKQMPNADNPHEKHELYKGVGRVWGLVALAAACIWVIPWIYKLFT